MSWDFNYQKEPVPQRAKAEWSGKGTTDSGEEISLVYSRNQKQVRGTGKVAESWESELLLSPFTTGVWVINGCLYGSFPFSYWVINNLRAEMMYYSFLITRSIKHDALCKVGGQKMSLEFICIHLYVLWIPIISVKGESCFVSENLKNLLIIIVHI